MPDELSPKDLGTATVSDDWDLAVPSEALEVGVLDAGTDAYWGFDQETDRLLASISRRAIEERQYNRLETTRVDDDGTLELPGELRPDSGHPLAGQFAPGDRCRFTARTGQLQESLCYVLTDEQYDELLNG